MAVTGANRRPILSLLGAPLRRSILRHYKADSCVASTAIGKLVLDALEIPSEPISVKLMLANAAWVARAEHEGRPPRDRAETERWYIESGAHGIGLGIPDKDPNTHPLVNGLHLALLVDGNYLWDLSIDQASRPQHNIVIKEPFLGDFSKSPTRAKFLKGQAQIVWQAPGQGIAVYSLKPRDRRYLEHVNWRADGHDILKRQAIAQEALLALRGLYRLSAGASQ